MRFENKVLTRKEADDLTEQVKKNKAKGLAYLMIDEEGLKGSIAKFITPEFLEIIQQKT
ncbi:TPA: hypothetical protein DEP21_02000 [Patescibacteria group bacterium]|nr:hypothetical protein [Candidatus Gracilibacteria bacterium]